MSTNEKLANSPQDSSPSNRTKSYNTCIPWDETFEKRSISVKIKASVDLVENYIQNLDWKINENSDMSYSLQGLSRFFQKVNKESRGLLKEGSR